MEQIVSYAGNYEDIILWDMLRNIRGVYIDVGANDVVECNVNKLFYDKRWHGINIDHLKNKMSVYSMERPRDINLAIGISNEKGILEYIQADVLSSFNPDKFDGIKEYCIQHGLTYQMEKAEVRTLVDVIDEYLFNEEIHFLKIDVENYEDKVIDGMDFKKYRPWVICIEALKQFSTELSKQWEHILFKEKYEFIFQVEGNRYYVAKEHDDLLSFKDFDDIKKKIKNQYNIYKIKPISEIEKLDEINSIMENRVVKFFYFQ